VTKLTRSKAFSRVILVFVLICFLFAGYIVFHILYFYYRSDHVGARLTAQEKLKILAASHGKTTPLSCTAPPVDDSNPQPAGLLSIPSIGLNDAPVVNGTDDAQLNVAIGHDPESPWPGQPGTAVLSAHDVTWFHELPSLNSGDTVIYETPCARYSFSVVGHQIIRAGMAPVDTPDATLILDTCWPINALYFTGLRYEVTAKLKSSEPVASQIGPALRPHLQISVPAPPTLSAAAQLNFPYLPFPLGTLNITGTPSQAWQQSTAPIDGELATLSMYEDAIYSLQHNRPDWFADLAPNISYASVNPLVGAKVTYLNDLNPTINVISDRVQSVTVTAIIRISNSKEPGTYQLNMVATVTKGVLHITTFNLSPS
jgi:sortase A